MHTRSDAIDHITTSIKATGVVPDAAAESARDGIADALYTACGDTWAVEGAYSSLFWWLVESHARSGAVAETAPEAPAAATDALASALIEAVERVERVREDLRAAESARDELLTCTHRAGAYSITELGRLAGLSRGRVSQVLS